MQLESREKRSDLFNAERPDGPIPRTDVSNVVPDHCATRPEDPLDFLGYRLGHGRLEYGAEEGRDDYQSEELVRKFQTFGVGLIEVIGGVKGAGVRNPLSQQVDAP